MKSYDSVSIVLVKQCHKPPIWIDSLYLYIILYLTIGDGLLTYIGYNGINCLFKTSSGNQLRGLPENISSMDEFPSGPPCLRIHDTNVMGRMSLFFPLVWESGELLMECRKIMEIQGKH
jgi:hypothetical protein